MNILYCGDKPMQKGILLSSMSLIGNVEEPLNIYILTVDYSEKVLIIIRLIKHLQNIWKES